jgi:hypothetical protein
MLAVSVVFKKLPKGRKFAQSGHPGDELEKKDSFRRTSILTGKRNGWKKPR